MKYNIAVVGATGNVGRETLKILAERNFPVDEIHAIASPSSLGKKLSFGEDKIIAVEALGDFDFRGIDIVFSSAGSKISKQFVKRAVEDGAIVIDKTSLYRMENDVPLVVPEVNGAEIAKFKKSKIISNPNCVAIPIATVLKPLDNVATVKRVVASTYQSTSGAGRNGMDELYEQTKSKYSYQNSSVSSFERQIAFNVIPKIDNFEANGSTMEESKIANEVRKILGSHIRITTTCVRVPVFIGHSISLNVEFNNEMSAEKAYEILSGTKGIITLSQNSKAKYTTPLEVVGKDEVFVSRIRVDESQKNTINMWVVVDNLRKGAALNAVQIAEELIKHI
ncbi:MAG: aspartate-semialdehyde dehydrogenase [Pseudomonadota bacterium]